MSNQQHLVSKLKELGVDNLKLILDLNQMGSPHRAELIKTVRGDILTDEVTPDVEVREQLLENALEQLLAKDQKSSSGTKKSAKKQTGIGQKDQLVSRLKTIGLKNLQAMSKTDEETRQKLLEKAIDQLQNKSTKHHESGKYEAKPVHKAQPKTKAQSKTKARPKIKAQSRTRTKAHPERPGYTYVKSVKITPMDGKTSHSGNGADKKKERSAKNSRTDGEDKHMTASTRAAYDLLKRKLGHFNLP
jgi:hypothetical protein